MANKAKKTEVIYKSVRFEIKPDEAQLQVILAVSNILRGVWNGALAELQDMFGTHIAPLYEALKNAPKEGKGHIRKQIKGAFENHGITLFDQINTLTKKRAADPVLASVPRNWAEETLDALHGGFRSFMSLRKAGDFDAKPPWFRRENDFSEIPGRFGFSLPQNGDQIRLSCGKISGDADMSFSIPDYQKTMLSSAVGEKAVKKFTLSRDEKNLKKPGRFWISITYEIPRPKTEMFDEKKAVFIALGTSLIGVISPHGPHREKVIRMWRPDMHWKPLIENAKRYADTHCAKGSRKSKRLDENRRRMWTKMSRQQTHHRKSLVKKLLRLGRHFVVSDLVVRSKKGRLADSNRPERGGSLGLNWSTQSTASLGLLVKQLQQKTAEYGGSVQRFRSSSPPVISGEMSRDAAEMKIEMARHLRREFLSSIGKG